MSTTERTEDGREDENEIEPATSAAMETEPADDVDAEPASAGAEADMERAGE
jgi:hypothetical protein